MPTPEADTQRSIVEYCRSFPSFAPLFQNGAYLTLLRGGDLREAFQGVTACIQTSLTPNDEIVALLSAADWRPNIVGGIAVSLAPTNPITLHALYGAMDASWASPQLAVIASLIDPDFATQAQRRIEALCPSYFHARFYAEASDSQSAEAESPLPDGGIIDHFSGKLMLALIYLCRDCAWLPSLLQREDIQQMLTNGRCDDGGQIAADWYGSFVAAHEQAKDRT